MITITSDYLESDRARAIPGAFWDSETRSWLLDDPTPRAALAALRLFPGIGQRNPELYELRDSLAQNIRPIDKATEFNRRINAPLVVQALRNVKGDDANLFKYQAIDLGYLEAVLRKHGGAYLGWERGLGKTIGAVALIEALEAQRVLIVAPNKAKWVTWQPELERWAKYLPHEVVVMPNEKTKRERVLEYIRTVKHPIIVVTHYQQLNVVAKMRAAKRGWDRIGKWDLVVADEVHHISSLDAQWTRSLKRIPTHMRLAMDGSIIMNHAEELFSPLQWLFKDHYSSKWRDWNDRFIDYLEIDGRPMAIGVKIEQLAALREELGVFMVYRRKEDELDLPSITWQDLPVELSANQRRVYDQLESDTLAELDSGEIIKARNALALLSRLRQVATGLDLLSMELRDSSKQDVAVELIEDNPDSAFVVFSWYVKAAEALAARLNEKGIETFVAHGGTPDDEVASIVERFQAGSGRVLVSTIKTLGESVTLTRADQAIFLDRSWNPQDNAQAADRIYRIGQTRPVTITNLVAKDTVDEHRVSPVLDDKAALRRIILGGNR